MSTAIWTHFSDEELQTIDVLMSEGVGATPSEVIRYAVKLLGEVVRRHRVGEGSPLRIATVRNPLMTTLWPWPLQLL